jgi:hypothetical protein
MENRPTGKMSFSKYLNEEYITTIRVRNSSIPVFLNPDSKELRQVGPNIRFIIDFDNKNFYIFDATDSLHYTIFKELNLGNKTNAFALGQGDLSGKKIIPTEFLFSGKKKSNKYAKEDFTFVKKYFELPTKEELKWMEKFL